MRRRYRGLLCLMAVLAVAAAPPAGLKRTELQRADLSVPNREVVQVIAELPPAAASGRHAHPGEELGYVLQGNLVLEVDGRASAVLKPGDGFTIPAGHAHNARNSGVDVAKVLSTYIVEKGKPLATPVP